MVSYEALSSYRPPGSAGLQPGFVGDGARLEPGVPRKRIAHQLALPMKRSASFTCSSPEMSLGRIGACRAGRRECKIRSRSLPSFPSTAWLPLETFNLWMFNSTKLASLYPGADGREAAECRALTAIGTLGHPGKCCLPPRIPHEGVRTNSQ
jgi:hypothetical protein